MAYIYSLADTWADGATTFKGISLNVTDTASAAGSLLMDLQVGGVSQFRLRKDGLITMRNSRVMGLGSPDFAADWYVGDASGNNGFGLFGAVGFGRSVRLDSTVALAWNIGGSSSGADLGLHRDAANTLAQRNGVNAQAFNLYQSYTDASNYTRGKVSAASGIVTVAGESAGTGATDIDIAITPKGTGRVRYGTHAAIAAETVTGYIEIKDAGGTVRKIAVVS